MPSLSRPQLRNIIKAFPPAWFVVNLGTGIVSNLLVALPHGKKTATVRAFSAIFLFLNIFIFVSLTVITVARHIMFPKISKMMLRTQGVLFYCAYPMALSSIIGACVVLLYTDYGWGGLGFIYFLWSLWWFVVVLACICVWWFTHVMSTKIKFSLEKLDFIISFPAVPLIVAGANGAVLAGPLANYNANHALVTIVISLIAVLVGLGHTAMTTTVATLRIIIYGQPKGLGVIPIFTPLGGFGQAGVGLLLIGQMFTKLLPLHYGYSAFLHTPTSAAVIMAICVTIGMVLWTACLFWLICGLQSIYKAYRDDVFPFRLQIWALAFPNGAYAALSLRLGDFLDSKFFKISGQVYALVTIALWFVLAFRTGYAVVTGHFFDLTHIESVQETSPMVFENRWESVISKNDSGNFNSSPSSQQSINDL